MSTQTLLARAVPVGALAALLVSVPAGARLPKPDQAFLDRETQQLEAVRDSLLAGPDSPSATLDGVRVLLAARGDAVSRLEMQLPLTSLDGIETLDLLDDAVVRDLHALVAPVAVDSSMFDQDDAFLFAEAMVGVPPIGEAPVGFMVLTFTELAVAASDSVEEVAHIGQNQAALLAVNAIQHVTDLYLSLDEDVVTQDHRASFRYSSVLYRLRCPNDQSGYEIASEKNRVLEDQSLARVNILVCPVCGDSLEVTFRLVLPSALHQRTPEQHLDQKPQTPRPSGEVEP
jgi:hypothetical protein